MLTCLGIVALLALTRLVYLPVSDMGYIWDDDQYVYANPNLRSLDGLGRIWFTPGATKNYYPVTFTSFFFEYRLWGLEPLGYHTVNVLLHGMTAALLWLLLCRLEVNGAFLAAALFAVHPVHVESVAWISERKNVLSGLLFLAAGLAYLKGHDRRFRDVRDPYSYVLSLLLFTASVLAKSVTCTWPLLMLLVLWWRSRRITRRDLLSLAPFAAIAAVVAMVAIRMERALGAVGSDFLLSWPERILVAGRAVWFYLAKLLWPRPIIFIYPRWQVDPWRLWWYLYPLGVVALLGSLWRLRHRIGRGPVTALLYFTLALSPALGFVDFYPMKFSFVADHFQYLASIGPIAFTSAVLHAGLTRLSTRLPGLRPLLYLVPLVLVVLLIYPTWHAEAKYRNQGTLWTDTLEKNPDAWIAHNNLGVVLARAGYLAKAISHFQATLRLKPGNEDAAMNLKRAKQALLSEGTPHRPGR